MSSENSDIPESLAGHALSAARLSVVSIFGIIVPGIWLCFNASIYVSTSHGAKTFAQIVDMVKAVPEQTGPALAWVFGICVVYVSGSVLRTLPPDHPDVISRIIISLRAWMLRRCEKLFSHPSSPDTTIGIWDRFPYNGLPAYLEHRKLTKLRDLVPWADPKIPRSKTFLHFVKLSIAMKRPQVADHLSREEAFIRLLSGVFYAIVISSFIGFYPAFFGPSNDAQLVCKYAMIANLLILVGILWSFHYQRLREMVKILTAHFLIGDDGKSPYPKKTEDTQQP
jgi:hypothetical protein